MPGDAEYGLLGPLRVHRGGAEVTVAPGKQRVVLAVLLLRGGRVVGLDELAEALWGEQPPASARATVHNYVARLRKALSGGDAVIVTEPGGYRIVAGPGEVDAGRFEAALAAGRAAARAGDWARAAEVLAGGLALWRGEPLAGIGSEVLAARDGARLAELRSQASEALAEADLHLGRHAEVIAALRQLAGEQPLRERLHVLLMTALYRDGQQAAALAAYQDARAVLAAELGADPGPELRELHQQVLNADPALAGPAPDPAPSPGRLEARYSLPPDAAAFTGRDEELAQVTALPAATGSVGVVAVSAIGGMPGAVAALAVHAAHALAGRYPDRQLFIDLHAHTPGRDPVTPEDALAGLLAATGTDPRFLPGSLAGRAALWRDKMAGQRALLVLDNAASSAQVTPLLPGGGGCLVLVTSRRHLGDLPGAVTPVLVDVLPPAQAAAMFTRLAPRAAASPAEVAEVVALAGCLPLAVSLLARVFARHPAWTLADLAAETRQSLLTLTAENASVAAAFEVSWRHLDPARQRLFSLLGLHPGTTTDAFAAAALAGTSVAEATGLMDGLHAEGLVTETGYRRYGMHDLLRRYARDHTAALPAADARAALERLLDYYARAATRAEACLARQTRPGPPPAPSAGLPALPDLTDDARALAWARAERAGLLACLDHVAAVGEDSRAEDSRVVALTAGLAGLLRHDGPSAEAVTRHAAAARAAQCLGDRLGQAGALNDLADAQRMTGDYPAAVQAHEQALGIYHDLGDRLGQANALSDLAQLRHMTGDYRAAGRLAEDALGIYRDLGDRLGQANALNNLGDVRRQAGDYPAAAQAQEEALGIYRDIGYRHGQATALIDLGQLRQVTGDYPAAARLLEQALGIYRDLGNRLGQANALLYLGLVRQETGDYPAAARALEQALDRYGDIGNRHGQAHALMYLGVAAQQAGDYPAATPALEQALGIYRDMGDRGGEAEALNHTGAVHRAVGEAARAERYHRQALELARAVASSWDEAHALAGLGRCALAAGHAAEAGGLLRQALEIFQRTGAAEAPGLAAELDALTGPPPAR